jgi:hypothetical protein
MCDKKKCSIIFMKSEFFFSLKWHVRFSFAKFRNNFHFYFAKFRENTVTKFCEISRNKIKISRNTKLIFGAKFRIAKFRIDPTCDLIELKVLLSSHYYGEF